MEERRKSQRTELISTLIIKRLDGPDDGHGDARIEIVDVSKEGIGFTCGEPLELGAVYEAFLRIWTQEVLHSFLRIVRIELKNNTYVYGAVFIGMAEIDASRIETYQTLSSHEG